MKYIGEHLLPGQLGHFAAVLSLVASLVATIAFFQSNRCAIVAEKLSWLKLARAAFIIETGSVITIIACVYYILPCHHAVRHLLFWGKSGYGPVYTGSQRRPVGQCTDIH